VDIPIITDVLRVFTFPLDSNISRLEKRTIPKRVKERKRSIIITLLGKGLKGSGKKKNSIVKRL
jgi:hypothetical protein